MKPLIGKLSAGEKIVIEEEQLNPFLSRKANEQELMNQIKQMSDEQILKLLDPFKEKDR
ncbi:MAG: hypothetical protein JXR30_02280 [Alphaproteobacteria bacterium]|nr:hypothetical protein [Alphaproteobacteria bacterium]